MAFQNVPIAHSFLSLHLEFLALCMDAKNGKHTELYDRLSLPIIDFYVERRYFDFLLSLTDLSISDNLHKVIAEKTLHYVANTIIDQGGKSDQKLHARFMRLIGMCKDLAILKQVVPSVVEYYFNNHHPREYGFLRISHGCSWMGELFRKYDEAMRSRRFSNPLPLKKAVGAIEPPRIRIPRLSIVR